MQTKLLIPFLFFILSLSTGIADAQRISFYNYEIIISTGEGTIRTRVTNEKKRIRLKTDRFYYGYCLNGLFCKQGELQGKPLDGKFSRYDLKDNILESGQFKYGLKEGLWKSLSAGGNLTETWEYKNGVPVGHRVIYKNGKPDILEKYRKGKLTGKPIYLNPLITQKKGETKIAKMKKRFNRLFKHKSIENQDQPKKDPKNKKAENNSNNR